MIEETGVISQEPRINFLVLISRVILPELRLPQALSGVFTFAVFTVY